MVELTRAVRFCVNPAGAAEAGAPRGGMGRGEADNSFAGYPSMRGLGRYYELEVACRGEVDPSTGYFLNIKVIDRAVRAEAVPLIEAACRDEASASMDPARLMPEIVRAVQKGLGPAGSGVKHVRWKLTPYYSVEMSAISMTGGRPMVLLRQQFDFAASHRLHTSGLSDAENQRIFGKCNNPSGHGHNYRVEPCVEVELGAAGPAFSLAELERVTNRAVIERFDHKHLNVDTPEFVCEAGGVNPSVENIAKVVYDLLALAIAAAAPGGKARLRGVTVWETDKTSCTYPG